MLVLSRHVNERILFPELGIAVRVLRVEKTGRVRLGIEAPPDISIVREELHQQRGQLVTAES